MTSEIINSKELKVLYTYQLNRHCFAD